MVNLSVNRWRLAIDWMGIGRPLILVNLPLGLFLSAMR